MPDPIESLRASILVSGASPFPAFAGVPVLRRLVIPKITIASLAVYSVMGGIGYGFSHLARTKDLGRGLVVASFIGAGYALSHLIVTNVAPSVVEGEDPRET